MSFSCGSIASRLLAIVLSTAVAACATNTSPTAEIAGNSSPVAASAEGRREPLKFVFDESVLASAFRNGFHLEWLRTMNSAPIATLWHEASPVNVDQVAASLDEALRAPESTESGLMTCILRRTFGDHGAGRLAPQLLATDVPGGRSNAMDAWCAAVARAYDGGFRSLFVNIDDLKGYGIGYPSLETGVFPDADGFRIVSIGVVPPAGISIRDGFIVPPLLLRVTEFVRRDGTYVRRAERLD